MTLGEAYSIPHRQKQTPSGFFLTYILIDFYVCVCVRIHTKFWYLLYLTSELEGGKRQKSWYDPVVFGMDPSNNMCQFGCSGIGPLSITPSAHWFFHKWMRLPLAQQANPIKDILSAGEERFYSESLLLSWLFSINRKDPNECRDKIPHSP